MPDQQVYTWDEMAALDCLFETLKETHNAVLTGDTLPDVLAASEGGRVPAAREHFRTGLAKLRREPRALLGAWASGKATWLGVGEDPEGLVNRFVLAAAVGPTRAREG